MMEKGNNTKKVCNPTVIVTQNINHTVYNTS